MTAAAVRAPSSTGRSVDDLPPEHLVLGRASSENFPVASKLLPAARRFDLLALYGWARLVDQLGDDYPGDRLAALDEVEAQLRAALSGHTTPGVHPLVQRMASTARRLDLPVQPLFDLVQANRQDQLVRRYSTFEDLVGYCRLSADPVGRTVLAIFGVATPERVRWSDSICTGLQLTEHWQDVAEDALMGRVYIPLSDMARFGVEVEDLLPPPTGCSHQHGPGQSGKASAQLRALMAFEVTRARWMLDKGAPLVRSLGGRLRFAVAGFLAGGYAALDAIAASDFNPFAGPMAPSRRSFAVHLARLVIRSGLA
ncbi:MAG: squalene synthase HpnC [Acidimicrobiales bacterium]